MLTCAHFERGSCQSCPWLTTPYAHQLTQKMQRLQQLLQGCDLTETEWLPPVASPPAGFRNKAKMVVSGTVERPILGILPDPQNPHSGVDLCDCPLYPSRFLPLFPVLKDFIARAGLVPYNTLKQKGELKHILLTESRQNQQVMLRFVLRSAQKLPLIRRELAGLRAKLPQLAVISCNIQPQHAARLEGEQEILLTDPPFLAENFNGIPLFIRPQGFFQTNPTVAEKLYAQAQQWVLALNEPITALWDLFCGVGGFGLHCAAALQQSFPHRALSLTGIEISPQAVQAATQSARLLGLKNVRFCPMPATGIVMDSVSDSTMVSTTDSTLNSTTASTLPRPDLVIVNPPRRGIGTELVQFLCQIRPHFVLYSSCNAQSMVKDLQGLTDYRIAKIQLFDMFPHTAHYEVLTLLIRKN